MIWFKSCYAIEDIGVANIRSIDMNLLCVFDALFDERSVTRAAGRLSVTQPTVSGMLQRLRLAFSDQLFVRSSHGILPTPRAEALPGQSKTCWPMRSYWSGRKALIQPQPRGQSSYAGATTCSMRSLPPS